MSPRIENLRKLEAINTGYFTIDLLARERFDSDLFDQRIAMESIGSVRPGKTARFMVIGDVMFIFPSWQSHSNFYTFLRNIVTGELQCGGFVSVTPPIKGSPVQRKIYGYSGSLSQFDDLPKEKSNGYRDSVIKEKLGEFFEIADE